MANECMSQAPVAAFEAGMSMLQGWVAQHQSDEVMGMSKRLKLDRISGWKRVTSCALHPMTKPRKKAGSGNQTIVLAHACRWACRRDKLLELLCEQLAGLGCRARRNAIEQCFTESQRLALEQWMVKCYTKDRQQELSAKMPMRGSAFSIGAAILKSPPSSRRIPLAMIPNHRIAAEYVQMDRTVERLRQRTLCAGDRPGLICQVSLATGRSSFYALACIGMVRLTTRKCRDRALAMEHSVALAAICSRVATATEMLDQYLKYAINEVIPQHRSSSLGLRLSVRLCVHRWAGTLATPCFRACDERDLERGLRAWRRLHDARQAMLAVRGGSSVYRGPVTSEELAAWRQLRETFLDIEEEAGLNRTMRAARLRQAERAKAAHRDALSEMWNRKRMAQEEMWNRKRMAQEESLQHKERYPKPSFYKCFQLQQVKNLLSSLTQIEQRLQHAAKRFAVKVRLRKGGSGYHRSDGRAFLTKRIKGKKGTSKRCNHLATGKVRTESNVVHVKAL